MRIISLAVAAIVYAWPISALADWQYTKWGMSVDQVIAASKGAASQTTPEISAQHSAFDGSQAAKLSAPYCSGTFQFTAYFMFGRRDTLTSVSLELAAGDPHILIGELRTKYGKPTSEDADGVLNSLIWYAGGDMISIVEIESGAGTLATVSYQPRLTPDNSGL
jgi:hypothetical protein